MHATLPAYDTMHDHHRRDAAAEEHMLLLLTLASAALGRGRDDARTDTLVYCLC
jgi:hypothetical protein